MYSGICSAIGDSSYTTFDGKMFSFTTTCEQSLLALGSVLVTQQNLHCGTSGLCGKKVVVSVGAMKIELAKGMDLKVGGVVFPDGNYRWVVGTCSVALP
ncbi:hypothetical protein DPMN_179192 [Dreissena polymorpha]|uniref:VWFD domain-containing protein n=1 Tax=Dreissena polymorpha TaxID=45954 RepID=A0A9D4EBY3_DREPO|nr:hypothetical protein DPMN_179192 [Dreissena polymorpha]